MFKDRIDAGKKLAEKLKKYQGKKDAIILALPRGGVVVGEEIARELKLPLDIIVTRKIGFPGQVEYAIGAVGQKSTVLSEAAETVEKNYLDQEILNQRREIARRLKAYRGNKPELKIKNKTVILVDDGIATGLTMIAAIKEAKLQNPKFIILAVPVASPDTVKKFKKMADELVILKTPEYFSAVGQFYDDFQQVTDKKVMDLLTRKS